MLVKLATHCVYPNGRVPYEVVLEVQVSYFGSIPNVSLMHISANHTELYYWMDNISLAWFFRITLPSQIKPESGVGVHRDWSCHKTTIGNFSCNPWQQASSNNCQNVPSCFFWIGGFLYPPHCFYKIVVEEAGAVWHWKCQRNDPLMAPELATQHKPWTHGEYS